MLGAPTTAMAIDAFESRFTQANGAHFLIAANRKEAYPISEEEGRAFRALYRRRMVWARWIRRLAVLGTLPLLVLIGAWLPKPSEAWRPFVQQLVGLVLLGVPAFGLIQHPVVSDFTKVMIERRLKRRMTTRLDAAIKPARTPLGRLAMRLVIGAAVGETLLGLLHALGPREEFAAYMRVLHGLESGNESWTARLTANLTWLLLLALFAGLALLALDRRNRRLAGRD